jgi:hypothetical protein
MFLSLSLAIAAVCSSGCGDDCHHSCPIDIFSVDVENASDVAAVSATGPCAPQTVTGSQPGIYFFSPTGLGVCHLTVSFRSGAPDFVSDVKITPNPGPCCVNQAVAETSEVYVPDLGPIDAGRHD